MEADRPQRSPSPKKPRKPLDPLVKTALTISIGLILLTVIGMILTAPDRSIPPYSVMAQIADSVTVNVPPRTTDGEIEALLVRFRVVGEGNRDRFRRLKIKPTTPTDPGGPYQRLTIYILDNPGLAEEAVLKDFLAADPAARGAFQRGVRGVYWLGPDRNFGALGYVNVEMAEKSLLAGDRVLFQGKIGK